LERGDDFIAAAITLFHLILVQIVFGFFPRLFGFEGFQFFRRAGGRISPGFWDAQVLVRAEGAAEVDAPDSPIFANLNVGEVGIGIVDQLVETRMRYI